MVNEKGSAWKNTVQAYSDVLASVDLRCCTSICAGNKHRDSIISMRLYACSAYTQTHLGASNLMARHVHRSDVPLAGWSCTIVSSLMPSTPVSLTILDSSIQAHVI